MDYKGYKIIAEVNVNNQCDFELDDDGETILSLTPFSEGEVDSDNIADFLVEDPEGDEVDWRETIAEAKQLIDEEIEKSTQSEAGN